MTEISELERRVKSLNNIASSISRTFIYDGTGFYTHLSDYEVDTIVCGAVPIFYKRGIWEEPPSAEELTKAYLTQPRKQFDDIPEMRSRSSSINKI